MFSSMFNFSDLEHCQYDGFDLDQAFTFSKNAKFSSKEAHIMATQAPSQELSFPLSRSKKTCTQPFESSFECNYNYQHFEALQAKLQNFMESVAECSKKIQKLNLKERIQMKEISERFECYQIIDQLSCSIDNVEKKKFKLDLQYEKKMKEFLDEVCKKVIPEIAGEFIAVANFVWLQYLKVMDQRLSESELIKWAQNLAQTKFNEYKQLLEKTKNICFEQDEEAIFPNFEVAMKDFMNFYFVTIVLTVEQYFENPYFNDQKSEFNSFKRYSSEEDSYSFEQFSELQEDILGGKKIKIDKMSN